jgi:hypothetical protein
VNGRSDLGVEVGAVLTKMWTKNLLRGQWRGLEVEDGIVSMTWAPTQKRGLELRAAAEIDLMIWMPKNLSLDCPWLGLEARGGIVSRKWPWTNPLPEPKAADVEIAVKAFDN